MRIALFGSLGDRWPAGVGQTENLGHLVKSFANGIIGRLANQFVVTVILEQHDLAVAAAHNQRQHRELRCLVEQKVRVDMRFDMVNRIERFMFGQCQRSRRQRTDQQRADQSRHRCAGNRVDFVPATGLDDGPINHRQHYFEMRPRRHLWHHAAIDSMNIDL